MNRASRQEKDTANDVKDGDHNGVINYYNFNMKRRHTSGPYCNATAFFEKKTAYGQTETVRIK